jgi:sec-independent protein translocase protein TatA
LFGLGLPEIVVIGGVAAVLFGPSKLPELGKSLGKTVKSFQEAAKVRGEGGDRASARDGRARAKSISKATRDEGERTRRLTDRDGWFATRIGV